MSNPYEKNITIYWLGYNAFCMNLHEAPKKVARNFYLVREWQRGYNAAYFDNIKGTRLKRFEIQKRLQNNGPRQNSLVTGRPEVQATSAPAAP